MGTTMKAAKVNVGKAARMLAAAAAVLLLAAGSASAQAATEWQGDTGDWFEPSNWTAGVPTPSIDAWIDNGGTARVALPGAAADELIVGRTLPNASFLEITDGDEVSNRKGYLGYDFGSQGTATVSGSGSKWTNRSYLYVGVGGTGTLNITDGGQVSSEYGYLGYYSGSQGTATVSGSGSKWTNSGNLKVGSCGTGTLSITDGGQVSSYHGYLGGWSGSQGTATVSGSGSKWTNQWDLYVGHYGTGTLTVADGGLVTAKTLYASLDDLLGDGTIEVRGAVLDANLQFDATHRPQPTIAFGTGGALNLNLDGAGDLGAGYKGIGTITITEGIEVASYEGYLGCRSGSQGTATVSGSGSKWTNSAALYVGVNGTGTLSITDGGQLWNTYGFLGCRSGSQGTATVSGSGSKWTNHRHLYVGYYGTGTLNITDGGEVASYSGYLGYDSGSQGTALVTGSGSKWKNGWYLSVGHFGTGTLIITDGGQVAADSVSIKSRSRLAIDVGQGSLLTVGAGTGPISNNGAVRVLAGAAPAGDSTWQPILAGTWDGSGQYQPIGGTWDGASHVFTVSAPVPGMGGSPVALDLSDRQRVLINDSPSGWTLGASFPASADPMPITFTAQPVSGDPLYDLQYQMPEGHEVFGAWQLSAESFTPSEDEPVYLSFDVGLGGLKTSDIALWHYDGSQWAPFETDVFTYDGQYASVLVTGFSAYAVSAVPEPGTLVLLLVAAFAGVLWQWRRGRAK